MSLRAIERRPTSILTRSTHDRDRDRDSLINNGTRGRRRRAATAYTHLSFYFHDPHDDKQTFEYDDAREELDDVYNEHHNISKSCVR